MKRRAGGRRVSSTAEGGRKSGKQHRTEAGKSQEEGVWCEGGCTLTSTMARSLLTTSHSSSGCHAW